MSLFVAKKYRSADNLGAECGSPPLPPHLIVARAGLDEGIRARVQHALFTFTQRSNDGAREVHYRAPDPGSDEQVRQVVAIVEHQTPPQEWPW